MKTAVTCIICPNSCRLLVWFDNEKWNVEGAKCPRGIPFAITEQTNPMRTLTSTVSSNNPNFPLLPVKTEGDIPKKMVFKLMAYLRTIRVNSPVQRGDVIIKDILGTGVNLIATCNSQQPYGGEHHEITEPVNSNL